MFDKRTNTPIEERNYAPIYLVFSGLLFLGTMWAVIDEVSIRRPWKDYQREFYLLGAERLLEQHTQAVAEIDSSKLLSLEEEIAAAEGRLADDDYINATGNLRGLLEELDIATRDWRFARSRSDAAYYEYKKNISEGKEDPEGKRRLDEIDAEIAKHASAMNSIDARISHVQALISRYTNRVDSLKSEKKLMLGDVSKLEAMILRTKAAPIEIHQTVLNDFDKTNFGELKARVDRCVTCHAGYKDPLYADTPQPFKTHPLPELLAIHSPEKFGCTPCHRGQGPALTKGDAHGDADPYWEFPILRGKDVYAGCNSCHASNVVVNYGPRLTRAKQLLLESGCFGCHDIKNYTDLPKIGPGLNDLTAKVRPEWIFHWVKNPKAYNPHTRMPDFRLSDDEAEAVTAYLVEVARQSKFKPASSPGSYAGGFPSRGKDIVETVGCKGCHVVGDDIRMRTDRGMSYDIAPELTWVGGKVNPDWLYDWVRNPRHYHPNTRMPSLRLTDAEARDVVAYLMSLKDNRPVQQKKLDLADKGKIETGLRVLRGYGCFGCHNIRGMENESKVSVALSDFGRKHVEQMDFGDTKVAHTWDDWVRNKLKDSRVFQTDRIVQKMPVYAFSEDEIETLRMLLKSFQRDEPSELYRYPNTKRERDLDEGRKLSMWYNCVQCHQVEERGGHIAALLEDQALRPPMLTGEGAKVQEPWLHGFLRAPSVIRSWLNIRMPTFDLKDEEISVITKYFLALSKQELELRDYAATPIDQKYLAPGKKLFDSYQCAKCHPAGAVRLSEELVASNLAPDLGLAARRLKPEWIEKWLHDPQKVQPGTAMPTFFYEGQAPDETILGGNADEQIRALKTYLWSLGKRGVSAASGK